MEIYYFTFGSNEKYPYQNTYIAIIALNYADAIIAFKERYADVNDDYINCSNYYNEEQWKEIKEYYRNIEPAEVIWTEGSLGHKPEGFNDLYIYVPDMKQIIWC